MLVVTPGQRLGPDHLLHGLSLITQEATQRKNEQAPEDDGFAANFIRGPTQGNLHDGLRQAIDAHGQANKAEVVTPGQFGGVKGKHRQNHEHAEHAQRINAGQPASGFALGGQHGEGVGSLAAGHCTWKASHGPGKSTAYVSRLEELLRLGLDRQLPPCA